MFEDTLRQEILTTYNGDNLINIFHLIENHLGHFSKENLLSLSKLLNIPLAQLHSTASFYAFFNISDSEAPHSKTKNPKNHFQICECLACEFNGANNITKIIEETTNLKAGESNAKFLIEKVQCIGACDKAPAMLFNGNLIDELTVDKVKEILKQC